MRTHVPVSVSLPPDLFAAAERRAAQLGFKRATYVQQLILADLRRQRAEDAAAASSGVKASSLSMTSLLDAPARGRGAAGKGAAKSQGKAGSGRKAAAKRAAVTGKKAATAPAKGKKAAKKAGRRR